MRKQTPVPDKKEKDVSCFIFLHRSLLPIVFLFSFQSLRELLCPVFCSLLRWIYRVCIWPTQRRACVSRWWNKRDPELQKAARVVGPRQEEGNLIFRQTTVVAWCSTFCGASLVSLTMTMTLFRLLEYLWSPEALTCLDHRGGLVSLGAVLFFNTRPVQQWRKQHCHLNVFLCQTDFALSRPVC